MFRRKSRPLEGDDQEEGADKDSPKRFTRPCAAASNAQPSSSKSSAANSKGPSTSKFPAVNPRPPQRASLLNPPAKFLSRSRSESVLSAQKASLLTPSITKSPKSNGIRQLGQQKGKFPTSQPGASSQNSAGNDLLDAQGVREVSPKPPHPNLPFMTIPMVKNASEIPDPHGKFTWNNRHSMSQSLPDLSTVSSSEEKLQPAPRLKSINEIDCDLDMKSLMDETNVDEFDDAADFFDMDEIPDIGDLEYGEEAKPDGTDPLLSANIPFWQRQLDPVKRFMRNTLDTIQRVPKLINRSQEISTDIFDDWIDNALNGRLQEERPKLKHILSAEYLDHFLLPDEVIDEESLNTFIALLEKEETEEHLADHFIILANIFPLENMLILEIIYRALCNSENPDVRWSSLKALPQFIELLRDRKQPNHLLDLLCAHISGIRRFDGGNEPEIDKNEIALWDSLELSNSFQTNAILYLPIRHRTEVCRPTIGQVMDVAYEVISAENVTQEEREKVASTFLNFLDVLDKCTWKLRDDIFDFLTKCIDLYPPNSFLENHPILQVFQQAAIKSRADTRTLALKGLARIFEVVFDANIDRMTETRDFRDLCFLKLLVLTKLVDNQQAYRQRQRYYRFVVEVFRLIGEKAPCAIIAEIFGDDMEAIAKDSIPLIRLYYPQLLDAIGLDYLAHLEAERSYNMILTLHRLSTADPDAGVRKAATLLILGRQGFGSPDVLENIDDYPIMWDCYVHYIPNAERAKFNEPWTDLPGWDHVEKRSLHFDSNSPKIFASCTSNPNSSNESAKRKQSGTDSTWNKLEEDEFKSARDQPSEAGLISSAEKFEEEYKENGQNQKQMEEVDELEEWLNQLVKRKKDQPSEVGLILSAERIEEKDKENGQNHKKIEKFDEIEELLSELTNKVAENEEKEAEEQRKQKKFCYEDLFDGKFCLFPKDSRSVKNKEAPSSETTPKLEPTDDLIVFDFNELSDESTV
ncbi:unnamed protein product [Bursaphelenchus xylophilus]|uniref:(pine wood nematode) hypothetical protein n=1 Tax=Bursaphelenchus xylophilus TaxID=6326 RepID=A0A1I7SED8_BURXY|nr:unnamed protein product [Bursaphelenchus xylophilus]CAG9104066.1 unnamed protein product [Bursaphelenchus xylophilus]